MEKYCTAGQATRWQYGARALHAGYISLEIHTQNMYYLLPLHCNNGCTNAPQCHVMSTLPVLLPFFGSAWKVVIKELLVKVGPSIRKVQDRGPAFAIPSTDHRISYSEVIYTNLINFILQNSRKHELFMILWSIICSKTPLYYLRPFVSAFRCGLARITWSILN